MKITRSLFGIVFLLVLSAGAFGQNGQVLAGGDPALAQTDLDAVIHYYERALLLDFSDEQRAELGEKFVTRWKRIQRSNPDSLRSFMKTVRAINAWDHDKLEQHHGELADAVLSDLKSGKNNEFNLMILALYEERGREEFGESEYAESNVDQQKDNFTPVSGPLRVSDLAGKWVKGSVSSYGYRNTVTDSYRSGYGSANIHEIKRDGSFSYSNYATVASYGCTTELYTSMNGRVSLNGGLVSFRYVSGTVKGKDSCKREGFTRPAHIEGSAYRLERDGGRLRMCETGRSDPVCLYREEQ